MKTSILWGLLLISLSLSNQSFGATGDDALINEALASHTGTDNTEYIEIFGAAGFSLDGLSLIVVESDAISSNGAIDRRIDFGASDIIGSNGFFLIGNPLGLAANYGVTPNIEIGNDFLENSSLTVALVETSSIVGASVSGAEIVLDTVAITDGGLEDSFFFGAPVIGPDGSFFPAGVRRVADGVDTDAATDWVIGDFNLGSANTPTSGDMLPPPPPIAASIMEIQGEGHISSLTGENIITSGIVTAKGFNGFYMQDAAGDGNINTSDGIFVLSGALVIAGDAVMVTGIAQEDIPGGAATGNLSTTRIVASEVSITASANPLPAPVILGSSGRIPPSVDVISDDETATAINLQNPMDAAANQFDPQNDGIDFFESLEGMLVTVQSPVAVSATRRFSSFSSEVFTLVNNGRFVSPRNARTRRGGISLQPDPDNMGDQNPERVQIQFDGTIFPFAVPRISVGDALSDVTGVVGYSFGNFEVNSTHQFSVTPSGLSPETTNLARLTNKITVGSYNTLNLSPDPSDDNQRQTLASQIVNNLRSPDILGLQEIQDNSGETNNGVVDADLTLQALIDAIVAAGGPRYEFVQVNPVNNSSGGVPGGNIRNAFLYNPGRVSVVEFKSLDSSELASAGVSDSGAFAGSRNPLLGKFEFKGREIIVINNHLSSRSGSSPIFGAIHPFIQAAEDQRESQTLALNQYVNFLIDSEGAVNVAVLGDFNTFEFTDDLTDILTGAGANQILFNMIDEISEPVYTFIFEGNSQALDHLFVTEPLLQGGRLDIVHVNVDFPNIDNTVGSDHEPLVGRFQLK
ncbi:MAG: endonuclease/exonuclease/phosphatase family protein [Deltaproteobacteria bacterium]